MEVNGILSDELAYQGRETRRSALRTAKSVVRGVMFRGVDRFVVVGHAIGKDLVCRYRVDPSRICVIGNGVNVDRFQPMEKNRASELVGLDPNLPRAIFVGNLVGWRDFDALFEAMRVARSRIASLQLAVVGDGPERARLEEVARRTLPPGSVLFTGEVPHYDVPAYICSGEVAILPAKPWSVDISPLKLFEYLACGRPVVAFDVAGLDFITSRGVGRLVSPGDGIGLGMAIADLIENAPARAEMGRRARECALTERSWVAIAGRVAEVLEEALRSRR
jgi:glycosyltransferase involved in cell wall biosynthesis